MSIGVFGALLGGRGLFTFGIAMISEGLSLAAGERLLDILSRWISTPGRGGDPRELAPDQPPYEGGFHDLFPSWAEFWVSPQPGSPLAAPAPYGEFIKTSVAASLCRR
jgi:hypothetical protein